MSHLREFFFFWTASEVYSNFNNKHFQSSVTSNPRSLVGDDASTWVMICMSVHYKVDQELHVDDDLLRSEKWLALGMRLVRI